MRQVFAHEALLTMGVGADTGAPGAAITQSLCGHWDHEPPCPLAPHHTTVRQDGDCVRLRVLFAVEPHLEQTVRRGIQAALSEGRLVGPNGEVAWSVTRSGPSEVTSDERSHAESLGRE